MNYRTEEDFVVKSDQQAPNKTITEHFYVKQIAPR